MQYGACRKYAKAVAIIVDDRATAFFAVCGNASGVA